jgi:uncharacterized membrane protein
MEAPNMADLVVIGYPDKATAAGALVKPGQAALAFTVDKATPDKTLEALAPFGGTVLKTSLSNEVEEEIQKALDAQGTPGATA